MRQPTTKLCDQDILNIVWIKNNFFLGKTEFMLMQVIQNIYQHVVN